MSSDLPHGRPLEKTVTDRTMLPQDEHHSMVGGPGSPNNLGTNGSSPLGRQFSIQLTPHQFEQLYLQPGGFGASRQEDLTKRFANPTVYGLAVFVLSLTPASTFFMGWMGTDTSSLTVIAGPFLFLAGIGLWTAGILEWILGNTFPFVVFASFSGLYLSLGYILSPNTNIGSTLGAGSSQYNNALAMYFIFWALMTFIFLIISLRTNVVFVFLFFTLFMFFALAAAAFNRVGSGNLSSASRLFTAAGAFVFACCMSAWLLFFATMLASNNFPLSIPLGDLSHFLETPKEKRNRAELEQRTMAAGAAR